MSAPLFNNAPLWGSQTRQDGPYKTRRDLRQVMPGVNGFRVYRMGTTSQVWTVTGRLVTPSRGDIENAIASGQAYMDGNPYAFTTAAGTTFLYCLLTDFRPIGNPQAVTYNGAPAWTQEVQGTVENMAPDT
jgi:hypothetical protein